MSSDAVTVANALAVELKNNPELLNQLRVASDPTATLQQAAQTIDMPPVWTQDARLFRIALVTICGICAVSLIGTLVLTGFNVQIPQYITTIGSTAMGSLVGLFVRR